MNRIILNETSYFGSGSRTALKDEILRRKFKHALVVSDKTLVEVGVTKKVLDILDENNIEYTLFDEVKQNPTITNVNAGIKACTECNADYLIAVGGGSVIDTAKAIGIVKNNPEFSDIKSLNGVANTKNKSMPIIALPTTAGTAAEVTINYVITNEEDVVKMVCVDPNDIPVLSIIDTDLMACMPAKTAAATGMDALTHAIEGYITKAAWDMTDMFHAQAINTIYHNLEAAVNKDPEAMDKMGVAQYIAGMGFSNVGLGIVHSMAHQLGAVYDTPHGVANALLLPYVMEFNGEVCPDKYRNIAKMIDVDTTGMSDSEAVKAVCDAVRTLAIRLNIPQTLREIGAKESDLDMLSEKALNDPCTPGNPRTVTVEAIKEIYKKAF